MSYLNPKPEDTTEPQPKQETVGQLGNYILQNHPGYPDSNDGAINTAIRIMKKQKEVLLKAHELRWTQRKFFETRRAEWLNKSKELEKEFDVLIEQMVKKPDNQKSLW